MPSCLGLLGPLHTEWYLSPQQANSCSIVSACDTLSELYQWVCPYIWRTLTETCPGPQVTSRPTPTVPIPGAAPAHSWSPWAAPCPCVPWQSPEPPVQDGPQHSKETRPVQPLSPWRTERYRKGVCVYERKKIKTPTDVVFFCSIVFFIAWCRTVLNVKSEVWQQRRYVGTTTDKSRN